MPSAWLVVTKPRTTLMVSTGRNETVTACEKCWSDACRRAAMDSRKDVAAHYHDLLDERKDEPCSPEQQAGQWWDGTRDSRR